MSNAGKVEAKEKELKKLSKDERIIYNSIMFFFPATKHETALDAAMQGGTNHQFICK